MNLHWLTRPMRRMSDERNIARVAQRDGGSDPPIPHWDAQQLPPACWRLVHRGMGTLHHTAQRWLSEDGKLHPDWNTAFHEAGQTDVQAAEAEAELTKAETAFRTIQGKDAPPSDRRFPVYWVVTGIWAVFEVPFTAVAFYCLGDNLLLTYVITLGLSIAIVAGAHFLGATLRSLVKDGAMADRLNRALTIIMIVVNIAVLLGVAVFRAQYLSRTVSKGDAPAQPLGFHNFDAFSSASGRPAPMGETSALIIFFAFGLLLFVNVVVLAFRRHDPALDTVFRRRQNSKLALKRRDKMHRKLARAKARREKRYGNHYADAEWTIASVKSLVELYKQINLQVRKDRDQHEPNHYPVCFAAHGDMPMPDALAKLEWTTALAAPAARPALASGVILPIAAVSHLGEYANGHQPSSTLSHAEGDRNEL